MTFYACDHPVWQQVPHGFSTRLGGVSPAPWDSLNLGASRGDEAANVAKNFRLFRRAIGAEDGPLVKNHQVHGTLVRSGTSADAEAPDALPAFDADGLVTDEEGLTLTVFSADCLPILFYDPVRRCIAAVHAGWRGTVADIAGNAVRAMCENFGCRPEDIRAAIGPNIGVCCFETHEDVPDAVRAVLGAEAEEFIVPAGEKFRVDLKGVNAALLRRAGVTHIEMSCECTACRPDRFWSHRRVGNDRGSLAAIIVREGERNE